MMIFCVLDLYETFICFIGVFNLSRYISKKVQKIFLKGLEFGEVGGRDYFFQNPIIQDDFLIFVQNLKKKNL